MGKIPDPVPEIAPVPEPEPEDATLIWQKYHDNYYGYNGYADKSGLQQSLLPHLYEPLMPSYSPYNQNIEYVYGAIILFSLLTIGLFCWCIICTVSSFMIGSNINRSRKKSSENDDGV